MKQKANRFHRISEADALHLCQGSTSVLAFVEEFSQSDGQTYIVTKHARGGHLLDYLDHHQISSLPEERAHHVFKQVVSGVKEMHKQGIVHRDLKHTNIFVRDLKEMPEIKIGDFGLACKLENDECIQNKAGTMGFMAPEII